MLIPNSFLLLLVRHLLLVAMHLFLVTSKFTTQLACPVSSRPVPEAGRDRAGRTPLWLEV